MNKNDLTSCEATRQTAPAHSDRLSQFNSRRLKWFSACVDECVAHSELHPGDARDQAICCYLEVRAIVGEGMGFA
jgi:hypothetical protein